MFKLSSVPSVNGGSVTEWGEFTTLRDCTIAARGIQRANIKNPRWFSASFIGDPTMMRYRINVEEPTFMLDEGIDIEIPIPNVGRQRKTVWLSEVLPLIVKYAQEQRR